MMACSSSLQATSMAAASLQQCRRRQQTRLRGIARACVRGLTYKDAGVDIDAGAELVRRIASLTPDIGGFGGLYSVGDDEYEVVGTDGVGTKLKLAFEMNIHDTVGIDLVAMNVNDIITIGADPMVFLDQFSTGSLDLGIAEQAIKGVMQGCKEADCVLAGGKAVENAGCYPEGIMYEMSGCAFGTVKKGAQIDGRKIKAGDVLIGLPSSGVHSNGFSLVRSILKKSKTALNDVLPGEQMTIGEVLLVPTRIYVKQVRDILSKVEVKGIAHITGGGFTDNIPRVLPSGLAAEIQTGSWHVPTIFKWLQEAGNVSDEEMFRTFNMGIGMVLVVDAKAAENILLENIPAYIIGTVVPGHGTVYRDSEAHAFSGKAEVRHNRRATVPTISEPDAREELSRRLAGESPKLYLAGDDYLVTRSERVDDKLKLAVRLGVHDTIGGG